MEEPSYLRNDRIRERIHRLLWLYVRIAAWGVGILVVFSVIFPIYACGCAGWNARRAACQSNMKQLGLALTMYAQDSDNQLPPITRTSVKQTWREAIYPYVKSVGVYRCSDDQSDASKDTADNLPHSYGANAGGWNDQPAISQYIRVVDMNGYAGPEWNMISPAFLPGTGRELHAHKPKHAFYQHPKGMVNLLFNDGHVKAMLPMATLSPVINLWTQDNAPFTGQDLSNAQAILKHAEDE